MVIKKPCAFPATAGDFNDHPLNTDPGPNFMGHVFRDGIQKSWLYLKESFLQTNAGSTPSYYTEGAPIVLQSHTILALPLLS